MAQRVSVSLYFCRNAKHQRSTHKQLVEELEHRKAAYELNLTIQNGVIVTKHPYHDNQGNNTQHNLQQHLTTQN